MKCPACSNELTEMEVDGIVVDVCEGGCGGIWFDWFEVKKFDEPHEEGGLELLDIARDASIKLDPEARRNCPKCEDMVMMQHFNSVKRHVTVDECPKCGGFWLDAGELGSIRTMFKTEEEKQKAAEAYMLDLFGDDLAALRSESEKKKAAAQKFARIFRFICPSYYIPGKQQGGAF